MRLLTEDFFLTDTIKVSQDLIGKVIIFNVDGISIPAIITETEAYTQEDAACHAFKGKSKRSCVMFEKGGISYVYLIYGMYHCLNFVTEEEGRGCAVLIRAVNLLDGSNVILNGPGKICRHLGINSSHNSLRLSQDETFKIFDAGHKLKFIATPRIGISKNTEALWRFIASDIPDIIQFQL